MLLAGKVISGAASPRGIGLATKRLFATHGARVVIIDLAGEAGGKAAAALTGDPGRPAPPARTFNRSSRQ